METACLVTGSEALQESMVIFFYLNIRYISLHWMNMYATIHNNHHKKYIDKKAPDMFTHLKCVCAKITSTELKPVLCCHIVDSGGGEIVLL